VAVKKTNGDPHLNEPGRMRLCSEFLFGKEKHSKKSKIKGNGNNNDIESRRTGRMRKGAPNIDITPTIEKNYPIRQKPFSSVRQKQNQGKANEGREIP